MTAAIVRRDAARRHRLLAEGWTRSQVVQLAMVAERIATEVLRMQGRTEAQIRRAVELARREREQAERELLEAN